MIHSLFPTLVYETRYEDSDKFLNILHQTWNDHFTDGYSHEGTGNLDLQKDERYKELYTFLSKSVREYLHVSGVVHDNFDINFVKSWMNIVENRTTPMHSHRDAHISVVYYANTPDDNEQMLRFYSGKTDREPFQGLYMFNSYKATEFNSEYYTLSPYKGQVLVFPSSLLHDTLGNNAQPVAYEEPILDIEILKKKRICIASDVILTFSEKKTHPLGLQPTMNWRTFND